MVSNLRQPQTLADCFLDKTVIIFQGLVDVAPVANRINFRDLQVALDRVRTILQIRVVLLDCTCSQLRITLQAFTKILKITSTVVRNLWRGQRHGEVSIVLKLWRDAFQEA